MEREPTNFEGAPPWLRPDRRRSWPFPAALVLLTLLGLLVRLPMLDFESGDYGSFLRPWYDFIRDRGFAEAMGEKFSDYTPSYLYLLALSVHFPFEPVVNIKLLTLPFDVLLAAAAMLIVRQQHASRLLAAAVYGAVILLPTVIWNGAMWGQCDSIFTAFVLLGLLFLLRERPWLALLMLGVAFAFKGQALFVAPVFGVLTLKGRIPPQAWVVFPLPYLAAILPAWLLGRSFWELVNTYRDQADLYHHLTLGAANIYQWLPNASWLHHYGFRLSAVAICVGMLLAMHPRLRSGPRETVGLMMAFALLCPFVMPRMHDRYFFIADVLSVVYVCYFPRSWFLPVLVVTASLYSYWPYLRGETPIPLDVLAALIALALLRVTGDLFLLARESPGGAPILSLRWRRSPDSVPA